jgi:hypothetical protein
MYSWNDQGQVDEFGGVQQLSRTVDRETSYKIFIELSKGIPFRRHKLAWKEAAQKQFIETGNESVG